MKTSVSDPQCFEFSFPRLDTAVEVEASPAGVVIRASRNSFSEERKACFIRELAAEGFIDDVYRWHLPGRFDGLRWVVDPTPFMPGPAALARTRRLVLGLFFSATALWLVLMGGLLIAARP